MPITPIQNSQEFTNLLSAKDGYIMIDFYADWCGPCKVMMPVYENLALEPNVDHVTFTKINRDENEDILSQYGFQFPTIPRFYLCKVENGSITEAYDFGGTQSKSSLLEKILEKAPHTESKVQKNEKKDSNHSKKRVAIIGAGPAGLTSAIYTSRAQLEVTVFTGLQPGGQLTTTTEIENFPGAWSEETKLGTDGTLLVTIMQKQAQHFGAHFEMEIVTGVQKDSNGELIVTLEGDRKRIFDAVIIASGASPRYLGIAGEEALVGKGYHSCATCDGFFYRGKKVIVVGGGDSAMEDAMFLTRFAQKVYIINRTEKYKASKIMLERAQNNEKIEFIPNTVIPRFLISESGSVRGVVLENTITNEQKDFEIDGVFVAIGHEPNSQFAPNILDKDNLGYLVPQWRVSPDMRVSTFDTATKISGLFVAGDIEDSTYRQAITAAGDGCKAAIDCERWLESQD
jgi:thioredoxin reductase (NADPH)